MARLLETAVAHQRDAVLITEAERIHPDGRRIIYVNKAFTALTGFSAEEAVGATPDITVGELTSRASIAEIRDAIEKRRPVRVEILKYRRDKTTFWAELDIAPVIDDDGACRYFICVMRDVTERRRLQSHLLQSDRLASIGTLAAGVAHEINNPLAYVIGNLEFLMEQVEDRLERNRQLAPGDPRAEDRESHQQMLTGLSDALHGANRVWQIVRDLRMFAGADETLTGPVHLVDVIDTAVQMVRNEARHRARIVREYADVPVAEANESRLSQAFLNLLMNAAQSIGEGHRSKNEIRVRLSRGEGCVRIEVIDTGVGIPAKNLVRIFDPFFSTKPASIGTGLGLSISHGIITSCGGRISVESAVGRGSTFRVELPLPAASSKEPEARLRLLVIDDDSAVVRSIAKDCAQGVVTAVDSGRDAMAVLAAGSEYSAIMCDLVLGSFSGQDLYHRVAECWPGLERRIIFLVPPSAPAPLRAFLDHSGNPWLEKPVEPKRLRTFFQRLRTPVVSELSSAP